jgi:hypothetical protein
VARVEFNTTAAKLAKSSWAALTVIQKAGKSQVLVTLTTGISHLGKTVNNLDDHNDPSRSTFECSKKPKAATQPAPKPKQPALPASEGHTQEVNCDGR